MSGVLLPIRRTEFVLTAATHHLHCAAVFNLDEKVTVVAFFDRFEVLTGGTFDLNALDFGALGAWLEGCCRL